MTTSVIIAIVLFMLFAAILIVCMQLLCEREEMCDKMEKLKMENDNLRRRLHL